MSIHMRHELGRSLRKCGYGITREYRWPEIHVRRTDAYHIEHVHILQIDTEGMDYDVLNWFFDADVQPSMINFENLHLGRRERSALRELLRANGYWRIETSQDMFVIKEFLARP